VSFFAVAGLLILAAAPVAAIHIESTAELRDACEFSPGNVVDLDHSTKILDGRRPPGTEQVASRCTIVLGNGANFETARAPALYSSHGSPQTCSLTAISKTSGRSLAVRSACLHASKSRPTSRETFTGNAGYLLSLLRPDDLEESR